MNEKFADKQLERKWKHVKAEFKFIIKSKTGLDEVFFKDGVEFEILYVELATIALCTLRFIK